MHIAWEDIFGVQTIDCIKRIRIRSYSGLYSVQMRENADQNNSGHRQFLCSDFFQEMQDSGKYNENFPGHRFESQILIQTQIRLNPISTLATKHLLIIKKNNLYLRLKVF